jgi:predicted TIM-barrel fold metal-dependent hydrolase
MLNGRRVFTTVDELLARYDAIGVEKAVLLPGPLTECSHQLQSSDDALLIARDYPDRFIPFCDISPRAVSNSPDADLGMLLRFRKEQGFKGIGEVACNRPFLDPMMLNLFKHVQDVGFPLTFHIASQIGGTYGIYDDPGLPQLERCLAMFPDLKFFGHSTAFWAEIAEMEKPGDRNYYPKYPVRKEGVVPKLFRQYPNLYGDLSAGSGWNALARDEAHALRFLEEFQDRLMFGTDICAPDTPTPLVDLLTKFRASGQLSEEIFQKVARENALRILGIA